MPFVLETFWASIPLQAESIDEARQLARQELIEFGYDGPVNGMLVEYDNDTSHVEKIAVCNATHRI